MGRCFHDSRIMKYDLFWFCVQTVGRFVNFFAQITKGTICILNTTIWTLILMRIHAHIFDKTRSQTSRHCKNHYRLYFALQFVIVAFTSLLHWKFEQHKMYCNNFSMCRLALFINWVFSSTYLFTLLAHFLRLNVSLKTSISQI